MDIARIVAALMMVLGARDAHAGTPSIDGRFLAIYWTPPGGVRALLSRVDLDALPMHTSSGRDRQYDVEVRARSVLLTDVLAKVAIPAAADLALLHFDDGLQIAIDFRDAAYMAKLGAQIARAVTSDRWAPLTLGEIESPRRPPTEEDLRPITFHGNKIVVNDPALASVLSSVIGDLRPWLYADSLFAIELMQRADWDARFDAGPAVRAGQRVYMGTCRFCHAVRSNGGALGWDLIEPYPIYSQDWMRRMKSGADELNPTPARTMLSIHVRFRAGTGGNRSMPALRGMSTIEVAALWSWLQAMSALPARIR